MRCAGPVSARRSRDSSREPRRCRHPARLKNHHCHLDGRRTETSGSRRTWRRGDRAHVACPKDGRAGARRTGEGQPAMPTLLVLAGLNGYGKSTLTATGLCEGIETIDPDAIARNADSAHETTSSGKPTLRTWNGGTSRPCSSPSNCFQQAHNHSFRPRKGSDRNGAGSSTPGAASWWNHFVIGGGMMHVSAAGFAPWRSWKPNSGEESAISTEEGGTVVDPQFDQVLR